MLNPRLRAIFERLLPAPVRRVLMVFEFTILDAVSTFARSLPLASVVLDAGCGESPHRDKFRHCRYIGIDNGCGDPQWNYNRLTLFGDLDRIPLRDASCDAVLSVVVLEHTHSPHAVLGEIFRVLRPGGRLLMVVPQDWEVHQAPHDFFRFTRYGMKHLFESSGLTPVSIQPVGGFFWLMGRRSVGLLTFFQHGWKWALFALLAPIFGFMLPVLFYFLDPLDTAKDFTLGYICLAEKSL